MAIRVGINCLSPASLPLARRLIEQGQADFCELMVDNFIHLSPAQVRNALPDVPLALHLVSSRFLEKSLVDLEKIAQYLRPWITALQPIYVSDHVVQFSDGVRCLPIVREMDYAQDGPLIRQRVKAWQSLLGVPLLLENHASLTSAGTLQAAFFTELMQEPDIGLLFDISNAYIAECNGICDVNRWTSLMQAASYFHIAGFRCDTHTGLMLDTHDRPIDPAVLSRLSTHLGGRDDISIVIECDAAATFDAWKEEIQRVRHALNAGRQTRQLEEDAMYQRLFGRAPAVMAFVAPRRNDILPAFVKWADEQNVSYGWSLAIYFLRWLSEQADYALYLTDEMRKELLQTAVIRWSLNGLDDLMAQGMLLRTDRWPGYAVGIWKATPDIPGRQIVVQMTDNGMQGDYYAISAQQDSWDGVEWVVVPA